MGDAQQPREPVSSDPLLLTPEEAAEVLRVGRTTIYALMKAGDLRPVHIGPLPDLPGRARALRPSARNSPTQCSGSTAPTPAN